MDTSLPAWRNAGNILVAIMMLVIIFTDWLAIWSVIAWVAIAFTIGICQVQYHRYRQEELSLKQAAWTSLAFLAIALPFITITTWASSIWIPKLFELWLG